MEKKICLLDLNYTLVGNQNISRTVRPFSKRMEAETYRYDLIEDIKDDYVILITARPEYQMKQTIDNIRHKTCWLPQEWYFNDTNNTPPQFKENVLKRFIFPKYGTNDATYYAIESNPQTRTMYKKYGIIAAPYEIFIKSPNKVKTPSTIKDVEQISLF